MSSKATQLMYSIRKNHFRSKPNKTERRQTKIVNARHSLVANFISTNRTLVFCIMPEIGKGLQNSRVVFNEALCIINPNIISLPTPKILSIEEKIENYKIQSLAPVFFKPQTILLKRLRTENERKALKEPDPIISIQFQLHLYCSACECAHYVAQCTDNA